MALSGGCFDSWVVLGAGLSAADWSGPLTIQSFPLFVYWRSAICTIKDPWYVVKSYDYQHLMIPSVLCSAHPSLMSIFYDVTILRPSFLSFLSITSSPTRLRQPSSFYAFRFSSMCVFALLSLLSTAPLHSSFAILTCDQWGAKRTIPLPLISHLHRAVQIIPSPTRPSAGPRRVSLSSTIKRADSATVCHLSDRDGSTVTA